MDRLNQIQRETAGGSQDISLNSTARSEAFLTANDSTTKYFSVSEIDSAFDITSSILSEGDLFEDNDNSYDGNELVIDDNLVSLEEKSETEGVHVAGKNDTENFIDAASPEKSKAGEVTLQIDGRNLDAIDIGNGLYLYRKEGQEELAAIQIIENDQQQHDIKFLKVRENDVGNLEVYEEIEIEVPEHKPQHKKAKDTNFSNTQDLKDVQQEDKFEKSIKTSDSRKTPFVSSLTTMTHSTPNKEGIPLTKTMVDLQLHPDRHFDNVKKTIEVHTDSSKSKNPENVCKKENTDSKISSISVCEKQHLDAKKDNKETVCDTENVKDLQNPITNLGQEDEVKSISKLDSTEISFESSKCPLSKVAQNPESVSDKQNLNNDKDIEKIKKDCPTSEMHHGTASNNEMCNQKSDKPNTLSVKLSSDHVSNIGKSSEHLINEEHKKCEPYLKSEIAESLVLTKTCTTKNAGKSEIQNNTKTESSNTDNNYPGITLKSSSTQSNTKSDDIENKCNKTDEKSTSEITNDFASTIIDNEMEKSMSTNKINETNFSTNLIQCQSQLSSASLTKSPQLGSSENANKCDLLSNPTNDHIKPEISDTLTLVENKPNVNDVKNSDVCKILDDKNLSNETKHFDIAGETGKSNNQDIKSNPSSDKSSYKNLKESYSNVMDSEINILKACKNDNESKNILISSKPLNNNLTAVPFGKWTEANRQDFLNKIKGNKTTNNTNANQIKQTNDLNRRDVLNKFDTQRQSLLNIKNELASMKNPSPKNKSPLKNEKEIKTAFTVSGDDPVTKEINNQDLIDKTIEGIINKVLSAKHSEPFTINEPITSSKFVLQEKTEHFSESVTQSDSSTNVKPIIDEKNTKMSSKVLTKERSNKSVPDTKSIVSGFDKTLPNKSMQKTSQSDDQSIINNTNVKNVQTSLESVVPKPNISGKDFKERDERNPKAEKPLPSHSVNKLSCLVSHTETNVNIEQTSKHLPETKISESKEPPKVVAMQRNFGDDKQVTKNLKLLHSKGGKKEYYSKLHLAYQSTLSDNNQKEENKDTQNVFTSNVVKKIDEHPYKQLTSSSNFRGCELVGLATSNSDVIVQEPNCKPKHQRKQILAPVETPELELIQPSDLNIEVPLKKKRKGDDIDIDNCSKTLVSKKSYLLERNKSGIRNESKLTSKNETQETLKTFTMLKKNTNNSSVTNKTASAIDSLVKAAELLETQSANKQTNDISDAKQSLPVKRGRGRPRKYPIAEATKNNDADIPSKKCRFDDSNNCKHQVESDESTDDETKAKENWTMGKINENILCPICNKLFRSENVVFKHVKHCSGPSPNRSEEGSVRSLNSSIDYDAKTNDDGYEDKINTNENNKAVEHLESRTPIANKDQRQNKKNTTLKTFDLSKTKNLPYDIFTCSVCCKNFRQKSYYIKHKLQHAKDQPDAKLQLHCEFCEKSFRKLHHLVQHRLVHNETTKTSTKNSDLNKQSKMTKDESKDNAGFRCEPCDKSFRKLHHLVEHRETHAVITKQMKSENIDINAEASLGKNSSHSKHVLSTKDIIHECSLCYMVFPNEHALNKHMIICQRKKKQAALKKAKLAEEKKLADMLSSNADEDDELVFVKEEKLNIALNNDKTNLKSEECEGSIKSKTENVCTPTKNTISAESSLGSKISENFDNKVCLSDVKNRDDSIIVIDDTPQKESISKIATSKIIQNTCINIDVEKKSPDKDDDEIRYMLNPNFQPDENTKTKSFMKVRSQKKSSLQIQKNVIRKTKSPEHKIRKKLLKPYDTDDDSIRYSFPKLISNPPPNVEATNSRIKSTLEMRKSVANKPKRKSSECSPKYKPMALSNKHPKRSSIEHRCDCGVLFNSAALLSRHTTLAHTPPRIRRYLSTRMSTDDCELKDKHIEMQAKSRNSKKKTPTNDKTIGIKKNLAMRKTK